MFQTFISTNPLPGLIVQEPLAQYTFYDPENAQTDRFTRLTQVTIFNRPAHASPTLSPSGSGMDHRALAPTVFMASVNHI